MLGACMLSTLSFQLGDTTSICNRRGLARQMTPDSPLEATEALASGNADEGGSAHISRSASVVTLL